MYKCVLFDMDGTLADTYKGIYHSYRYAFSCLGKAFGGASFVKNAIGMPLPDAFRRLAGTGEQETALGVFKYREYYAKKGKDMTDAYPGIRDCLERLREEGFFLCVATLKKEDFAVEILKNLKLLHYFDLVCGMDERDSLRKRDLIWKCMEHFHSMFRETILVGDSPFDLDEAEKAGIDFLGVTYGFGFQEKDRGTRFLCPMAESPEKIADHIIQAGKRS